jgi:hypothetical protein
MMYLNLFKNKYSVLKGKDWVRRIEPEDRAVFVSIGMEANLHGVIGGRRLAQKRGRAYMSKIGRIGAIVANSKRAWNKALLEEMWREGIMR